MKLAIVILTVMMTLSSCACTPENAWKGTIRTSNIEFEYPDGWTLEKHSSDIWLSRATKNHATLITIDVAGSKNLNKDIDVIAKDILDDWLSPPASASTPLPRLLFDKQDRFAGHTARHFKVEYSTIELHKVNAQPYQAIREAIILRNGSNLITISFLTDKLTYESRKNDFFEILDSMKIY